MRLSIRLRGSERGQRRDSDHPSDDPADDDDRYPDEAFTVDRRSPAARAARAYGGAANVVRKDAEVVISRSAAILTGDLDSVLRRAGQAIRQMAETLLGIDPRRTTGLVSSFQQAALGWVRDALPRYRAYAENHDRLPIGVSFEDVRLSLEADDGRLALNVGGVEFRNSFDFRATGVVFDIRASGAVREPTPGFFVDTGETGVQLLLGHVAGDLDHPGRLAVAIQYWIVGSLDPDRSSVLGDPLILGRLELAAAEPRPELLVVGTVPVGRLDEQAVMLALNFVEGVAQD
ncbi:hypothetical protein BAL199_18103 [alpha proteobacterium BAL199]|nr:hypothetical protein BAL199_18103 [alpha proteobacterium BAL199]